MAGALAGLDSPRPLFLHTLHTPGRPYYCEDASRTDLPRLPKVPYPFCTAFIPRVH